MPPFPPSPLEGEGYGALVAGALSFAIGEAKQEHALGLGLGEARENVTKETSTYATSATFVTLGHNS